MAEMIKVALGDGTVAYPAPYKRHTLISRIAV